MKTKKSITQKYYYLCATKNSTTRTNEPFESYLSIMKAQNTIYKQQK